MINRFTDKYYFLNNFYETPVDYSNVTYSNAEAAFQAQKTADENERRQFADMSAEAAKKRGREVVLRPDWEQVKAEIMYEVCLAKFTQNEVLKEKLLATGHEMLIYGNDSGDTLWGQADGIGENLLGKCLMRIRDELMYCRKEGSFDPVQTKEGIIRWIREYMAFNGNAETKAVIGISGGKDSTVAAALAAEALGRDRVVGVLMPRGVQPDIEDSYRVVKHLGIQYYEVNIGNAADELLKAVNGIALSEQAKVNTPPRIRMTTLYAVAACVGGRVMNTCNLSEDFVGYSTKFGDSAGDFSPLANLTVAEVIEVGKLLDIPAELVVKPPSDGLCGKTDEDNLGFTYAELDRFIRLGRNALSDKDTVRRIEELHIRNLHKLSALPVFEK